MIAHLGLLMGSTLLLLAGVAMGVVVPALVTHDLSDRRFLRVVYAAALLVRVALAVGTYLKLPYGYFAPDEASYVLIASNYVSAAGLYVPIVHGQGWIYVNIVLFYVFGTEPLLPRLWNCLVGAMTPLLGYALAREFGANRGARWSAMLIAFFPSLVLWSSLNLHDVDVYFVILLALLLTVRLQESLRWWRVVAVALTLAAAYLLRIFTDGALLGAVACGVVASRLRISAALARRLALAATALAAVGVVVAIVFPRPGQYMYTKLGLAQIASIRQGFASGARSAVDPNPGLESLVGTLAFFPLALVDFFLRPFPWERGSSLSALTRPEIVLYYAILPLVALGIVLGVRKAGVRTLPSLVFLAITGVGYALVISNLGTVYRERDELLIVMFTFVGVAVDAIATRLRKQRLGASSRPASRPTGGRRAGQVHDS